MTIQNILQKSSQDLKNISTTPLLDAEVFLCEAIGKTKEFILANMDLEIPKSAEKKFWEMIERRKKFEPVAYIVNKKEFFGLEFCCALRSSKSEGRVLIPRPETEMMVEMVLNFVLVDETSTSHLQVQNLNIIDVGTGSGCIIAAIARALSVPHCHPEPREAGEGSHLPSANFFALDASANSLEIAEKNFKNLNLPIKVLRGNLLEPYLQHRRDPSPAKAGFGMTKKEKENSESCFLRDPSSLSLLGMTKKKITFRIPETHIILANLPYLNADEYENCPPEVKNYEPKSALYGGKDGLKYIKILIGQIEKSRLENYYLILEISPSQAGYLRNLGFKIKKDLFGTERFAIRKSRNQNPETRR